MGSRWLTARKERRGQRPGTRGQSTRCHREHESCEDYEWRKETFPEARYVSLNFMFFFFFFLDEEVIILIKTTCLYVVLKYCSCLSCASQIKSRIFEDIKGDLKGWASSVKKLVCSRQSCTRRECFIQASGKWQFKVDSASRSALFYVDAERTCFPGTNHIRKVLCYTTSELDSIVYRVTLDCQSQIIPPCTYSS